MSELFKIIEIELKLFIRQKESLFYTFAFPLICLLIFAGIWGRIPGYVNILTSGIAAMIALNIAVFGTGLVLSFYRQYGFYKRLVITPIRELTYIVGLVITRLIVLVLVINLFLLLAHIIFDFSPKGSVLHFNLMMLVGTLSLTALAVFIVSLGHNQSQIIQVANLLFFPMLFLGGTFYSLDYLPIILKVIAYIFPYTYLVQGLSHITKDGYLFYQNTLELLVLFIWLFVCSFLAIRRFKFEEVI